MSKASLKVRHVHTESVVPEYHHAINHFLREFFWYIVASVVLFVALRRLIACIRRDRNSLPTWLRKSRPLLDMRPIKYIPRLNAFSETCLRCLSYRRIVWTSGWLRYLSPLSAGEILFLLGYWTILLLMLWTNVIFKSASPLLGIEWEVVGFRAAWVSTTQLPLVYCTGCRINPISLITGISHERLNWFHRWAARTVFLTLIVHWAFFYREWDLSNFVKQEIKLMPMVICGFAAWGMFGFMVITGFGLFRDSFYEIWLLVHVLSAYLGLWLTYTHTHCTTYFVLASVGFIAFDICGRIVLWILHNVQPFVASGRTQAFGYNARLRLLNDDYINLSVANVSFRWKAGQHIYVMIPQLRKIESHPFTIANLPEDSRTETEVSFIIKPRQGLTLDLYRWQLRQPSIPLTILLNGPYGNPPSLTGHDTIILISTGNRASFIVPLLQELIITDVDVSRAAVHLISRRHSDIVWYLSQIQASLKHMRPDRTEIVIQIHLTSRTENEMASAPSWNLTLTPPSPSTGADAEATTIFDGEDEHLLTEPEDRDIRKVRFQLASDSTSEFDCDDLDISITDDKEALPMSQFMGQTPVQTTVPDSREKEKLLSAPLIGDTIPPYSQTNSPSERILTFSSGKPSVDAMIRPHVIDARGKILVVAAVAGGLRSQISTCVARLNREIIMPVLSGRDGPETGPSSLELWCEDNGD